MRRPSCGRPRSPDLRRRSHPSQRVPELSSARASIEGWHRGRGGAGLPARRRRAAARALASAARPHPAGGRRPPRRPAARARRARHRQDDDDRRGGRRPHRGRRRPRADPRPDLQPQGRRRAAHPHHRAASRSTIREPLARTFHSYAYGVLRRAALLRGERAAAAADLGRAGRRASPSCCAATRRRRAPSAGRPALAPALGTRGLPHRAARAAAARHRARRRRRRSWPPGAGRPAASTGCTPPRSRSSTRP